MPTWSSASLCGCERAPECVWRGIHPATHHTVHLHALACVLVSPNTIHLHLFRKISFEAAAIRACSQEEIHAQHSNTCSRSLTHTCTRTHIYIHTLTNSFIHSPRAFMYSSKFLLSLRFHVPTKTSAIFYTTARTR